MNTKRMPKLVSRDRLSVIVGAVGPPSEFFVEGDIALDDHLPVLQDKCCKRKAGASATVACGPEN
jgi:hypothetical protein